MKTDSLLNQDRPASLVVRPPRRRIPVGFTLVEMLVVIAIIAMLAGLVTAAAVRARVYAKEAAITFEIKQLETACQAYKERFGEYPPDFTDQNTVMRHLAKAFPRYQPGITQGGGPSNNWAGFRRDMQAGSTNNLDVNNFTPASALTFWLGGYTDVEWNYGYRVHGLHTTH